MSFAKFSEAQNKALEDTSFNILHQNNHPELKIDTTVPVIVKGDI